MLFNSELFISKWCSWRSEHRLTMQDVCQTLGVSTAALSKVENRKMGPGLELYFVMCALMNVDPVEYMDKEKLKSLREKANNTYLKKFNNRYYSRYGR